MENTDQVAKVLIYSHAFFGGIGLITGITSILVKKGGDRHKTMGKMFSFTMLISALVSLIVARMPFHENLFLFLIGVFTIYMILAGNRALTFRGDLKLKADWKDKAVSGSMFLISALMLILGTIGVIQKVNNSILYLFFGGFGAFMAVRDFKMFRVFNEKKKMWLSSHIGRMVGALIASVTAFLVAGLDIGTVLVWIMPTVLGTCYIIYWNRRLKI